MITTKKVPPFIQITCEPDDEYQYIQCESSVAGLFFMRNKNGKVNIFTVENDKGVWNENTDNLSDMNPNLFLFVQFSKEGAKIHLSETCWAFVVTEKTVRLLPTKEAFEAKDNN